MSRSDLAAILAERAQRANLSLSPALSDDLLSYYRLLAHWNKTINLTSLRDPAEAVDRLLLEPIAAAEALGPGARGTTLIDLGSGGGSPAIPLSLALEAKKLVMIESRARKAAFLRAAARELALEATVESVRFEDAADQLELQGQFDFVSVRAVRVDDSLLKAVVAFLRPDGRFLLFGKQLEILPRQSVSRGT